MVKALQRVGQGFWDSDGFTKRLNTQDKDLHLWAAEWSKEGRIIFQAIPKLAIAPSKYHWAIPEKSPSASNIYDVT